MVRRTMWRALAGRVKSVAAINTRPGHFEPCLPRLKGSQCLSTRASQQGEWSLSSQAPLKSFSVVEILTAASSPIIRKCEELLYTG